MGCDIHASLEYKMSPEDTHYWLIARDIDIDRRYGLFSRIAGVRGFSEPIAEPRGLPKGIAQEIKEEYEEWKEDGHSMSWLTARELTELEDEYKQEPFYKTIVAYADKYGYENVRLVFWFDN